MIKYYDMFSLVKDYKGFKKGSIFMVDGFDVNNGIVAMRNNGEYINVDSDAMKALFVPFLETIYNDKEPVKKKREWSKWNEISYFDIFDNFDEGVLDDICYNMIENYICNYEVIYRTNGKRTEVKIHNGKRYFEGHSTCNKCDTFDINIGTTIAAYRALKKMIDSYIEEVGK